MFETIVATVLNKVLGSYIADLEQNQLKLGIFNGNVVLKNLKLKTEALDKLNLPVEVLNGFLGKLELHIPWANLKSQPVRVVIGDVFVLASPKSDVEYDAANEEERAQKLKQEMLETAELFRSSAAAAKGSVGKDLSGNESFMTSLVTKIVDNLQIVITNIHIRLEDAHSNSESPFALGLTLSNLSAVSTDANWKEAFLDDPTAPTHKLARLDSLSCYWTPRTETWRGLPQEQLIAKFTDLIYSETHKIDMRYLLKPVSGAGRIVMNKKPMAGVARNNVNIEFESFRLKLDDEQFYDVLMLAQTFVLASRSLEYRKFRPASGVAVVSEPLKWFRFAVTCVLEKIRARNRTRLWITVMKRRQVRKKYVQLFKKQEVSGNLNEMESAALAKLEEMIAYVDIKLFRSLARLEMKEEGLVPYTLKAAQSKAGGILSRWWPGGAGVNVEEEDVQRFYDTIGYDEHAAAESLSPLAKMLELNFVLKSGSMALAQTTSSVTRQTVLSLQFIGLRAHVIKRPSTIRAELSLLDLSVLENLVPSSLFPNVIRAKKSAEKLQIEPQPMSSLAVTDETTEIARMTKEAKDPFVSFVFDQLAENPNADQSLSLTMKPLEIVANHQAAAKLTEFLMTDRVKEALQSLSSAAGSRISRLAHHTRANLEHALETHKSIDIKVDIDAPIIYIPYNCEDPNSFVLVGDLGKINVCSRLVTRAQKAEFSQKRKSRLDSTELERLYELMYDVLIVKLSQIKLSYAESLAEWQAVSQGTEALPEANRIIDDIDFGLTVGSCIVPQALNLAQTRIQGKIPSVRLLLSDTKFKRIIALLEAVAPKASKKTDDDVQPGRGQDAAIFDSSQPAAYNVAFEEEPLAPAPARAVSSQGDSDSEQFFDAIEDDAVQMPVEEEKQVAEHEAVKVDLVLEVDEICATLTRENPKYQRKDLLTFVAKKLTVALHVQPFNTLVNVLLESFFIRDDLNLGYQGLEDVYVLSGLGDQPDKQALTPSLLRVNVNVVDPKHPNFDSQYYSAALQVVLELASLKCFVHPNTIVQAAEFFDTMFEGAGKSDEHEDAAAPLLTDTEKRSLKRTLSVLEPKMAGRAASKRSTWSESIASEVHRPAPLRRKEEPKKEGKILLNAKLSEFAVCLGIGDDHFADVVLSSAVVGVCVDKGDINFSGQLADLVVVHKRRNAEDFEFLRIEGDNVLDLTFKTFDSVPRDSPLYLGYDQMARLVSGSLHFVYDSFFLEDACKFGLSFAKEAQVLVKKTGTRRDQKPQGSPLKQEHGLATIMEADASLDAHAHAPGPDKKLHFEVSISSPVIDFPNQADFSEVLSIYLGELKASNSFAAAKDAAGTVLSGLWGELVDQLISAQISSMRMVLTMHDESNALVKRQLLDDVDLKVKISQMAKAYDRDYAETEVDAGIDVIRLKVGNAELKSLLGLVQGLGASVQRATAPLKEIENLNKANRPHHPEKVLNVAQAPHFVVDEGNPMPTDVEVLLGIKSVELVLFEEWEASPVACLAVEGLKTHVLQQKDKSVMVEQYVGKIRAADLRPEIVARRQFTEIIRPGSSDDDNEDIKIKFEQAGDGSQVIKAEVLAPQILLSIDFLKAVGAVFEGLGKAETGDAIDLNVAPQELSVLSDKMDSLEEGLSELSVSSTSSASDSIGRLPSKKPFIFAEIKRLDLFILENPDSTSTEAVKISIDRVSISQQTNMNILVEGIGSNFVNMKQLASGRGVQFIEPFDVTASIELNKSKSEQLTRIWAVVKPIIVRFSHQDIQMLANLASQFKVAGKDDKADKADVTFEPSGESLSIGLDSGMLLETGSVCSDAAPPLTGFVGKIVEQLQIDLEGLRLVFIDDFANVHIPFMDISVDKASTAVKDWSSALNVVGVLKLHANYFNRLNSHWEPVIEAWSLDLGLLTQKADRTKPLTEILLSSEKMLEFIASHAFVDQLLLVSSKIAHAKPRASSTYREVSKPYLIRNLTGHRLTLWSDARVNPNDKQPVPVELAPGDDLPFEFEDWRSFRKGRSHATAKISIHLMDSPWESVKKILVEQRGLFVYPLRPKIGSVSHKIVCQVELIDGVRHVILRSATCFKNDTQFDVEIRDTANLASDERTVVKAGAVGSLPILFSAGGRFEIRPCGCDLEQYKWSSEHFELAELLEGEKRRRLTKRAVCKSEENGAMPFCFNVYGISDTPEEIIYASAALAKAAAAKRTKDTFYGLGTITIAAPLELENLLPFDFKYRVYDRDGRYDFSGVLKQGACSPLHGVDSSHIIGLSLEIDEHGLKTSEIAVINNGLSRAHDGLVQLVDAKGASTTVSVNVEYKQSCNKLSTNSPPLSVSSYSNRFGARRVQIYSPYVIINQTGVPLEFKVSSTLTGQDQTVAGHASRMTMKPLLFSYPASGLLGGKNRIKIRAVSSSSESTWSKPLSLDAVGNVINFDVCRSEGERKVWQNLALNVRLGSDRFSRVHVVTVSPRALIANRIPKRCVYMQAGTEAAIEAEPDAAQSAALHCDPVNLKRMRVSLDGQVWSSPFSIAEVGETFLKLNCEKGQELVKISKVLQSSVLYVAVSLEKYWPYRIVNRSSADMKFWQKGFAERLLLSGESADFAWDDPSSMDGTLRISVAGQEKSVDLASLGPSSPLSYRLPGDRERSFLGIDVSADGPTVIARFFDFDPKSKRSIFVFSSEKDRLASEAESEAGSEFEVKEAQDRTETSFRLNLAGIGVSLIGPDLSEFMYVCAKGLEVRFELSRLFQTIGFKLKWLQIDNQLFDYTHPILLYPSVIKKTEADMEEHPTLNVGIIQSRMDRGVHYFKYCGVLLQELSIELGEELLRKLIQFAQFESIRPVHGPLLQEADFAVPVLKTEAVDTKLLYFELLQIHPIKINVTFSRIEQAAESEGGTMVASSYNPLSPILTLFSMAGSNISDAPLKFNSLLLEHPLVSSEALKNRIVGYYFQQAVVQMHVLLGSIDMLGNPVGLVTSMGSAVTDLFYEPYQGFVSDRPQDIGIGLAKGGISFVKKTVGGVAGTFSKLTGSLSKGLAAASMDASFQRERRTDQARNRPRNAATGITSGARNLYRGIASGLAGIVEKPIEGAKQAGLGGFLKGVGVGMLGAFTKPLVGAIDMTTSLSEGVRGTVGGDGAASEIGQVRWPRVIPYDSVITSYSLREAFGQSLLAVAVGLDLKHERYMAHLEVPEDESVAVLTTLRVLYLKKGSLSITWQVPYSELLFCRPNFDSVMLSVRQGDVRKRLVFCLDQASQEWFCVKIDEALAVYNEMHRSLE